MTYYVITLNKHGHSVEYYKYKKCMHVRESLTNILFYKQDKYV